MQGGLDDLAETVADGVGEAQQLALGEGLWGGEGAVEPLDDAGDGADARAPDRVGGGVECVDRCLDRRVDAAVAGEDGDAGLLPGRVQGRRIGYLFGV